jgi:hypothetical protein
MSGAVAEFARPRVLISAKRLTALYNAAALERYGETGADTMGVAPVNTAVETLPVPWITFFRV